MGDAVRVEKNSEREIERLKGIGMEREGDR